MKYSPKPAAFNARTDPVHFVRQGNELSLSGPALMKFLKAVLDKGAPFRFKAKGFSMSPFVRDGDVITISPLYDTSPAMGDVVACAPPGTKRLLVHRVVGKKSGAYLIKGDNTSEVDDLVPEANILGRMTRVERKGKKVLLGLGPERFLIAFLTRRGLVRLLLLPLRWLKHRTIKRSAV